MPTNYFIPTQKNENVYIVDIGEDTLPFIKSASNTYRAQYVIHFVVKGKGYYKTATPSFKTDNEIGENMAFAIYKQDKISYVSDENEPMHYFWIGFDGEESKKILEYIGFSQKNPVINIEKGEEILHAFNKIFTAFKTKHDHYLALSEFYRLISKLRKNNKYLLVSDESFNENNIIKAAIDYIHSNIQTNIKVTDLTKDLHVNRSYFSTAFKKIYGISPHQYIQQQRLHRARLLLTTTTYSISEIVSLLNFADIYTFSKQFKKHFKIPPLEYRNKYKNYSLTKK